MEKREEASDSRGEVASSDGGDAYFTLVFLTQRALRGYRIPAMQLIRTIGGPATALFPLSRKELGDIWTGVALQAWEVDPLVGGWNVVEDEFAVTVGYPYDLLRVLLSTIRDQRYPDGLRLTMDLWPVACRQPSDKLMVRYQCSNCTRPRQFAARALLDGATRTPRFVCSDVGATCGVPAAIVWEAPAHIFMLEGAQSVVGGSRMSNVLKHPILLVPPMRTAPQNTTPVFAKPAPSYVWTSLAEFQAQLPPPQHVSPTPIAPVHPSVKTPRKEEVDPSEIHPHDSVSNVTPGEGEMPTDRHSWGERPKHKWALECSMEATKHIEGKRLETFVEVDLSVVSRFPWAVQSRNVTRHTCSCFLTSKVALLLSSRRGTCRLYTLASATIQRDFSHRTGWAPKVGSGTVGS